MSLGEKLWRMHWPLLLLVTLVAGVGFLMLYSAADGSWYPWAARQMIRFAIGLFSLCAMATVNVRVLMRYAYVGYAAVLVLLGLVEFSGLSFMGARRWISVGPFQFQPSEVMKIMLILALARYFHNLDPKRATRVGHLTVPIMMILVPAALVLRQPDLGTALMLLLGGGAIVFVAGAPLWLFGSVFAAGIAAAAVGWRFLWDYQKTRILTFFDPGRDPLGAGYHIIQSKIALGSGGVFGRGFMHGTQSHLSFLPERQTDFIFTMFGEEMGLVGGLFLLGLYVLIIACIFVVAARCRHQFGRLAVVGLGAHFFLYVFTNIAMVMGLIPVVGVPLPLMSYGGTAMLSVMVGFGVLMSIHVHRDMKIGGWEAAWFL